MCLVIRETGFIVFEYFGQLQFVKFAVICFFGHLQHMLKCHSYIGAVIYVFGIDLGNRPNLHKFHIFNLLGCAWSSCIGGFGFELVMWFCCGRFWVKVSFIKSVFFTQLEYYFINKIISPRTFKIRTLNLIKISSKMKTYLTLSNVT